MTEAHGIHLGCPMVSSDSPQVLWRSHSTNIRKSNMQSFSEILNIYREKKKKKLRNLWLHLTSSLPPEWTELMARTESSGACRNTMQKGWKLRNVTILHLSTVNVTCLPCFLVFFPNLDSPSSPFQACWRGFSLSLSKRLFKQVPWNLRQILTVVPVQERQPVLLIFLPFLLQAWPAFPIFVELLNCEL